MLHALAREVFSLIEMGAASPEDIDKALKFGPGFRSATTGMLEVADMGDWTSGAPWKTRFLRSFPIRTAPVG